MTQRRTPASVGYALRSRPPWARASSFAFRSWASAGLFDALTFWTHGYRHVSCLFGQAVYPDLLAAVAEFGVKRVLTTVEPAAEAFLAAGLEAFVVRLPLVMDVNSFALATRDPADALGSLLRTAEWAGKGMRSWRRSSVCSECDN